jgi:predicted ATPase
MQKIPISGGPHTGKTTLFNALRTEYPQAYFLEEPAEKVIASELRKVEDSQSYIGIFPWNNYRRFARLAIDQSLELEGSLPADSDPVFQDRSLIDNIGYGKLNGYEDLIPEVQRHIEVANYAFAFFCEPVGDYTATLIRRETPAEAQRTHAYLSEAYEESGVEVVHLPPVSVEDRLAIIRDIL